MFTLFSSGCQDSCCKIYCQEQPVSKHRTTRSNDTAIDHSILSRKSKAQLSLLVYPTIQLLIDNQPNHNPRAQQKSTSPSLHVSSGAPRYMAVCLSVKRRCVLTGLRTKEHTLRYTGNGIQQKDESSGQLAAPMHRLHHCHKSFVLAQSLFIN